MTTTTVFRANVSVQEVEGVLRAKLGGHYEIAPSASSTGFTKQIPKGENSLLVKGRWFGRANVQITPSAQATEIEVSPGASYFGLVRLFDRLGVAQKVRRILENSPELTQ